MSSSAHIGNKKKYILVLRKGPILGLEHTLTAEKMYSINFTGQKRNSVYGYTIMKQIVIYLLMAKKFISLKQKILKLYQVHYA